MKGRMRSGNMRAKLKPRIEVAPKRIIGFVTNGSIVVRNKSGALVC
jgi:hypothetical protein